VCARRADDSGGVRKLLQGTCQIQRGVFHRNWFAAVWLPWSGLSRAEHNRKTFRFIGMARELQERQNSREPALDLPTADGLFHALPGWGTR
jgi:hypothetical protein